MELKTYIKKIKNKVNYFFNLRKNTFPKPVDTGACAHLLLPFSNKL